MAPPSGRSSASLPDQLEIRTGMRVALLHAPEGIEVALGTLPEDVSLQHGLRRNQQVDLIVGFVTEKDHLARNIGWLVGTLPPDGIFWVAWPERASTMVTDIDDDAVRAIAGPIGWVDVKVCAIDAAWSALKLVRGREPRPSGN